MPTTLDGSAHRNNLHRSPASLSRSRRPPASSRSPSLYDLAQMSAAYPATFTSTVSPGSTKSATSISDRSNAVSSMPGVLPTPRPWALKAGTDRLPALVFPDSPSPVIRSICSFQVTLPLSASSRPRPHSPGLESALGSNPAADMSASSGGSPSTRDGDLGVTPSPVGETNTSRS